MVKQKVWVIDTGLSAVGGSAISGYTKLNSGSEFFIDCNSAQLVIAKTVQADVNLARKETTGLYKEGVVQHNSVANRAFTLNGTLDIKVSANQTKYANIIKMVRSPAIFAMRNELTNYDDEPHGTANDGALGTNVAAGTYVFVVFNNLTINTTADDQNIVDFVLEAVLVND